MTTAGNTPRACYLAGKPYSRGSVVAGRIYDEQPSIFHTGESQPLSWQHLVTVEKMMAKPTATYPRVVAGKNACPPEDCGGPWGYADMRKVLAGRRNARRRELVDWLGGTFDHKAFDLDEARQRLAEYVEVSMPKTQSVV